MSFYAHVYIDKEYYVEGSSLECSAWFRRKRQRHFAHQLHANADFAVVDFFWDRMIGTYRKPDQDISLKCGLRFVTRACRYNVPDMEAATLPCRRIWTHDVRAVARQSDGL